jgi:hypothetical protein
MGQKPAPRRPAEIWTPDRHWPDEFPPLWLDFIPRGKVEHLHETRSAGQQEEPVPAKTPRKFHPSYPQHTCLLAVRSAAAENSAGEGYSDDQNDIGQTAWLSVAFGVVSLEAFCPDEFGMTRFELGVGMVSV